jgi:MFS family permease
MRLVGAAPAGFLVQRLGERRVYISGLLIVAVSTAACALAESYWQLLLFRSLGGVGSAMFTVSALGLMIRISPADARGRVAGLFSSGFMIGSVGGPILGSLTAGSGWPPVPDLRRRAGRRRIAGVRQPAALAPAAMSDDTEPPVPFATVFRHGLQGGAGVQLRDRLGLLRAAHRAGAAVRGGGAGRVPAPRAWR